MIYQTDKEFSSLPQIRPGACYFLSILRALSEKFHLPFTHETVMAFYLLELGDTDTDVDNEMFIGNPQNLIDDYIGLGKVQFLGIREPGYIAKTNEIVWGSWHREGTDFNHFVWMDGKGSNKSNVIYDPWAAGGSASVAQGILIGQRVARIIGGI